MRALTLDLAECVHRADAFDLDIEGLFDSLADLDLVRVFVNDERVGLVRKLGITLFRQNQ